MRILRRWIACSVAVCGVLSLCVYLGAAENTLPAAKPPDLAQRVAELEAKVAQLEKKLEEQATRTYPAPQPPSAVLPRVAPFAVPQTPGATVPQTTPLVAPPVPPMDEPKGQPYQFNGHTYYIVPLGKDATR